MTDTEHLYTLAWMGLPGIGCRRIMRLRERFGSLEAAWHAPLVELAAAKALGKESSEALEGMRRSPRALDPARRELETLSQKGLTMLLPTDATYPPLLREIVDPPAALFIRGTLQPTSPMVALVGTRAATPYGLRTARTLGADLAENGVTVVSGLAIGIDAAAHAGAVTTGATVAVLGAGLDHVGPACNRRLAEEIVARGGALLSEYPPGTPPATGQFPARNRIVSGMCRATVVVEAPERSGALITADLALEQGREVMAVPGSIDSVQSAGSLTLLAQGAKLVRGVGDILSELDSGWIPRPKAPRSAPALPEEEARVFSAVGPDPRHIDRIVQVSGLPASVVTGILLVLELKTLVVQLPGNHYVRHT